MGFDAHFALQIRRGVEQMLEQDDVLFVFMRLLRMACDGPGDEEDFFRFVRGEASE